MPSARRYAVARAAAETLFDGGAGIAPPDLDALLLDLDDFLMHARWRTSLAIRLSSTAVQFAPFLQGRFRRFTSLPPQDRTRVLLALERSGSYGKAWAGLKLLLSMLWFDGPGARFLPEQTHRTKILEEPIDPAVTRLGPEGPLPAPPRRA